MHGSRRWRGNRQGEPEMGQILVLQLGQRMNNAWGRGDGAAAGPADSVFVEVLFVWEEEGLEGTT